MAMFLHRLNIVFWTPLLLGLFIPVGAVFGAVEAIRELFSGIKRHW